LFGAAKIQINYLVASVLVKQTYIIFLKIIERLTKHMLVFIIAIDQIVMLFANWPKQKRHPENQNALKVC